MLAPGMYNIRTAHTQARTSKLPQDSKRTNKSVSFSTGVIPNTSVSRPQLKSNPKGDRVLRSNSGGKKLEVEEPRRNVKLSKNKLPVTACTANLNAKTVNVKSVSAITANVKDTMTSRRSTVSNTPLSSNSFAAHRDCPIHRLIWVLNAHDGKYQASN
uniref:Uncharacterized protein n=1 Tax=Tanacetum cinerariifolium TaxID=118510 RepID=A0A699R012_TANCI|nr:hypothetical protein [Tanacetum cinerariifolium]